MSDEKRGPGRPKASVKIKYKSISVPEDVWNELHSQATNLGTSVGKLACERIRNGGISEDFVDRSPGEAEEEGFEL